MTDEPLSSAWVEDPGQLWQHILDSARDGAANVDRLKQPAPPGATDDDVMHWFDEVGKELIRLHRLSGLLLRLHRHLITNGRFPAAWTDHPRRQMDGPTTFILARALSKDGKRVVFSRRPGIEGSPVVAIVDDDAVDVLEAIRRIYELGREESWQERCR